MWHQARNKIYISQESDSNTIKLASGGKSKKMRSKKILVLLLIVLTITPVNAYRYLTVMLTEDDKDRWNYEFELLFAVFKIIMILGFCISIIWRLYILKNKSHSQSRDSVFGDSSKSLVEATSIIESLYLDSQGKNRSRTIVDMDYEPAYDEKAIN